MSQKLSKLIFSFSLALIIAHPGCTGDISTSPTVGPVWKIFNSSNTPLRSNSIRSITSDQSGIVWIATDFGGYSYSPLSHTWGDLTESLYIQISYYPLVKAYNLASVTYAKDKAVWFGFPNGELIRYNPYATIRKLVWTRYRDPSVFGSQITSLDAVRAAWSPYGEVWAGTSTGMKRFIQSDADGSGEWVSYRVGSATDDHILCARTNAVSGTVWFGTQWDGVVIQAQYAPRFQFSPLALPAGSQYPVNSIAFDADSTIWIAQYRSINIYNIRAMRWDSYTFQNTGGQLPQAQITALESNNPNLHWIGTEAGLARLADTTWSHFTTANSSLPDNHVTFLRYDAFGNLWIGTTRGIAVYNPSGTRL
jgi:ligand-binding sensor domain-containing protein